jgi:glycine cleavage system H protein
MAQVNGCNLPEDLYYLIEKHVWVRRTSGDLLTIGINDVAQNLAGTIVACTPKKVGRTVPRGQSVATIESSKWVGPVPSPVSGVIAEVNESVRTNPGILNRDPYGAGWLVKLKPSNWEVEKGDLVTGPEGLEAYRAFLDREGIRCGEHVGAA